MGLNLFKSNYYNKDGTMNYDRASKFFGLSKSDLQFFHKGHFPFIDAPTLMSGVMVAYRPTSTNPMFHSSWIMKTCYHSNSDLKYINDIITKQNVPEWATYDYFIMDASGRILYKNCDVKKTVDENGVIHLDSDEHQLNHVVYPAERKKYTYKHYYCCGKDMRDLNEQIKELTNSKIIVKPSHFKRGFEQEESIERE